MSYSPLVFSNSATWRPSFRSRRRRKALPRELPIFRYPPTKTLSYHQVEVWKRGFSFGKQVRIPVEGGVFMWLQRFPFLDTTGLYLLRATEAMSLTGGIRRVTFREAKMLFFGNVNAVLYLSVFVGGDKWTLRPPDTISCPLSSRKPRNGGTAVWLRLFSGLELISKVG
jgi:hypothetical protein